MNLLEALALSILQGATEFLPVSSKTHLLFAQKLFEGHAFAGSDNIVFDVLVHAGTLISIVAVYRARLAGLVRYGAAALAQPAAWANWRQTWLEAPDGRMIAAIALATIPTGLIGLGGMDFFRSLFNRPDLAGWGLCLTAALLASTRMCRGARSVVSGDPTVFDRPLWTALVVGVAQGLAVSPGISRSGATISVALFLGFGRPLAGDFAFLMSIPAIIGACLVEWREVDVSAVPFSAATGVCSLVVSAVVGWLALQLLLRFVRGGQFAWFSVYCLALGVWALVHFS